MKRPIVGIVLACVVMLAVTPTLAQEPKLMSVLVKEAHLRAAPSPLGKIAATVPYTAQVEVLEDQGAWIRVKIVETGAEGWMHDSALTQRAFTQRAGDSDVAQIASSSELALAGKMFNEATERAFKSEGTRLNYAAIDAMEQRSVSRERLLEFVEQGNLLSEGGAE